MSPYRRPALKYTTPKRLKTLLKRKIKFAWDRANNFDSLLHVFRCHTETTVINEV